MYDIKNLIYKNTVDAYVTLSSATAVWSSVVVRNEYFKSGIIYVDMGASNASAASRGTQLVSRFYESPDQKVWYLVTALPVLTSAGAGGLSSKRYSKALPTLNGQWFRLNYACYSASAKATTEFRVRLGLTNDTH